MNKEELFEIISCGETSTVQFKQQMTTSKQIAEEMVAFANCKGGIILFGIEDKTGQVIGLSYPEIQQISHEISTAANDQIRPSIYLETEVVVAEGKRVLVAHVMEGNLLTQYTAAMNFISRNLMTEQTDDNFNSNGQLEVPLSVFVELIVNALIHRDYYQSSAIRLFVFDDRIELHSPGTLPSDLTVEDIKKGISKPRNQLLFEFARYFLPYTGVGSGILRVAQTFDNVDYYNDLDLDEFRITIPRKKKLIQTTNVPHDVPHDVPHEKDGKSRQERIMDLVRMNPGITRELMAKLLGVNAKTIGRELAKMKDKITYRGSGNHGHWEIIE